MNLSLSASFALPAALLLTVPVQAAPQNVRHHPLRAGPQRTKARPSPGVDRSIVAGYYLCTRPGGTELDSLRLNADGSYLAQRLVKTTGSNYSQDGQYTVRGHEISLHFLSTAKAKWTGRTILTTFTITSDANVTSDGVLKTYIKQPHVGSLFK